MCVLIETERLQMREFTLDDVDAVYEFSTCSDVTRFTGDEGVVKNKRMQKDSSELSGSMNTKNMATLAML